MKRLVVFAVLTLFVVSCQDIPGPGDAILPPQAAIVDAAHGGVVEHFYFLPPLVPEPVATGFFDGTLKPVVEICEWSSGCTTTIATFTTNSGPGSETVRVDTEDENYIVNWHTDEFDLNPDKTYRIRVLVAGTELGYADVDVASSGKKLENVDTDEFVPLLDGRTLPIKFRIEAVVDADGGVFTAAGGNVTIEFAGGAVSDPEPVPITAEPVTEYPAEDEVVPGTAFDFGPNMSFAAPVMLTIGYDEAVIPEGVNELDLRIHKLVDSEWVPVLDGTVDTEANTASANIEGFSTYVVAFRIRRDWICYNQTEIPLVECEALAALYTHTNGWNWDNSTDWFATLTPCSWAAYHMCAGGSFSRLDLGGNNLTGTIPPEIGNFANLGELMLQHNELTGPIPPELGNLTNLDRLHLEHNQLTGTVPSWLGSMENLFFVNLEHNQLEGDIPSEIGNGSFSHLDLSSNQLTGDIPYLGNLVDLRTLDLSSNQLTGGIPSELGSLPTLNRLDLSDNQLTGGIPSEFGNLLDCGPSGCAHLPISLLLHSNQLSGLVPLPVAELGGMVQGTRGGTDKCMFMPPGNEGLYMFYNQEYRWADLDNDGYICGVEMVPAHFEMLGNSVVMEYGSVYDVHDALDPAYADNPRAQPASFDNNKVLADLATAVVPDDYDFVLLYTVEEVPGWINSGWTCGRAAKNIGFPNQQHGPCCCPSEWASLRAVPHMNSVVYLDRPMPGRPNYGSTLTAFHEMDHWWGVYINGPISVGPRNWDPAVHPVSYLAGGSSSHWSWVWSQEGMPGIMYSGPTSNQFNAFDLYFMGLMGYEEARNYSYQVYDYHDPTATYPVTVDDLIYGLSFAGGDYYEGDGRRIPDVDASVQSMRVLVVVIKGKDDVFTVDLQNLLLDLVEDLPSDWSTATWGRSTLSVAVDVRPGGPLASAGGN